jgi:hypothetical protein
MQLVLSDEEAAVMRDLLASHLPDHKREVARTERHDLRHLLVLRQELAERLIEELRSIA